ncbi:MAG: HlyD family efflux transporter periplasmic adaptor subunit [Rubripirellula sp.]|jgi:putative peptide zinc metalloprotease protein|nr:HlyD family efflux transporter periplasmic adaptor subunit [Rubripirellula sp.]
MTIGGEKIVVRPDLIHRRVWMGKHPVWVIKDPISGDFYHYGDREYEVLSLADGYSVAETMRRCHDQPALANLSQAQLSHFLNDAIQKRLIHLPGVSATSPPRAKRRWWQHPLAMRLPGISPTWILDRLLPLVSPLMSPPALIGSVLLMVMALLTIMTRLTTLMDDIAESALRIATPQGCLLVMAVIAFAKILHELSHALTCRRLGGHVREMGIMLLVGIPCLYCDVSDAWLFDRRWKRIAVSAAGMWAELTLAAIATLLWAWTAKGPLQDVCVTLMVVCSVSTLLFNGNPLLRYDGYYMLSDWVGIPNLASQSSSLLRSLTQRWLWGTPIPRLPASFTGLIAGKQGQVFLTTYGLLSSSYRLFVLTLIMWWLYRGAHQLGLGSPVGLTLLVLMIVTLARRLATLVEPPSSVSINQRWWNRGVARGALAGIFVVALAMIPLPRHIFAPMTVQSAESQELFVTVSGRLIKHVSEGTKVRQGDPIVVLHNPDVDRELMELETRCDSLRAQLDNLRKQRGVRSELSQRIPVVSKSLAEAEKQLQLKRDQAQKLTLQAPRDGVVFPVQPRHQDAHDDRDAHFWNGTPLDSINQKAWLEQGTVVGMVGDESRREAILLVPQEKVELLRSGQPVTLRIASLPRGAITGTITDVAISPLDPEIDVNDLPGPPQYQVRVRIEPTQVTLPVRLQGNARITVDQASVLQRIGRFLAGAFSELN